MVTDLEKIERLRLETKWTVYRAQTDRLEAVEQELKKLSLAREVEAKRLELFEKNVEAQVERKMALVFVTLEKKLSEKLDETNRNIEQATVTLDKLLAVEAAKVSRVEALEQQLRRLEQTVQQLDAKVEEKGGKGKKAEDTVRQVVAN